ncbi:ABC transporter permease [Paenibacillus sedimenti]|uniref:ABC transporter permease n=1 Tax=Paenibacillus sedimenti TaxID=2770274 RepID=A0A926KK72_9BACL|nr:ABC transporter permease [Paenibacillus sedimenti]MBD0379279.1 ABC transporter permease [Paenibacillus sedimenti]
MTIWVIAWYEMLRILRMRYVLIVQFILPLLLIFILGSALSNAFKVEDRSLKPVEVDIVQSDKGSLSNQFQSFLAEPEIKKLLNANPVSTRDEAVKRVKAGESEFALIVPADFSTKVITGQEAGWEMILGKDYDQNLIAQMTLRSFLETVNLIQATALTADPAAINMMKSQAGNAFQNPVYPASYVRLGKLSNSDAAYTATQYYAASMLVMFLLYSGMAAAIGLQSEKEVHTLSRLNSLPISNLQILLGKVLGNTGIALLQAFVIIGTTTLLFGVDWGHSFLMLFLVCLMIIIASMSLAILAMCLAGSTKTISMIFQILITVMTFLSGGFSPLPDGLLHKLGVFTVNHWGMQGMLRIMLGSDNSIIMHHVWTLVAIAAGLLIVSLVVYRKAGYHE